MKTNQTTFFGIAAALIAVIFTLAAFTACPQPAEETPAKQTITIDPTIPANAQTEILKQLPGKTGFLNIEVLVGTSANKIQNGKMTLYFDWNNWGTLLGLGVDDQVIEGWLSSIDFDQIPTVSLILRKLNQRQA